MTAVGIILYLFGWFLSKIDDHLPSRNEKLEWVIVLCAGIGISLTLTGIAIAIWRVMP